MKNPPEYIKSFNVMQWILFLVVWGAGFNIIAIQNNNGDMPVYQDGMTHTRENYTYDNKHFYYYNLNEVKTWYLTDIINLGFIGVASVGDMLLFIGVIWYLTYYIKINKKAKMEGYS